MFSATKGFLTRPSAVYYVSTSGSDSNNGLTTGAPFATPAAALTAARPGSTVLLQCGGIWTAEVNPTANGLTLGAYGTGAKPVIDRGTEPTGAIFNDGFESETSAFTTNWGGKTESSSTVTLETTSPVRGSKSLKYTQAANGTAYVSKTLTSIADVYVQFKVKINKLVTGPDWGTLQVFQILGGFGNIYIGHDDHPKRGVQVRMQGGDVDVTNPTYYQEGQTLRIELRYKAGVAGTSGTQCWVNGNLIASDLASSGNNATGFRLGNTYGGGGIGTTSELVFDDVKVSATALGVGTRGDNGITVQGNDCTVQDIEVRNTEQYFIKLRDCLRATVRRNSLHDCTRVGVIANIGGGDHTIEDNEISFTGGDTAAYGEGNGIQFLPTTTGVNTVRRNYIHHIGDEAGDHGIYSEGGANLITLNRFYGISGFGVKCIDGSAGSSVWRNRMEFCRAGAVHAGKSSSPAMASPVNIYHNSTYLCGVFPDGLSPYTGFWITGYAVARLVNNIGSLSAAGITVEDATASLAVSNTNDIYYDARFGYFAAAGNQATLANWHAATGLDGSSIESDPLYTDPDAGDLTLQSGSPAKNIGTVIAGINDGYLGAAPDLGYIEVG
jgi:hypothetical protein